MSELSGTIPPDRTNEPAAENAPPDQPGLSRRRLFLTLIGSAALVGASLPLTGPERADAQSKTPKKVAKYQDHPKSGQQCSKCRFFLAPKSCQLVAGDISPNGWCSFYAAKAA